MDPRAPYDGPTAVATFPVGGRTVRLVRPVEPDRLLDDPAVQAWNLRDDYMPYWAYLWAGAIMLAEALAADPRLAPAGEGADDPGEVLEIGCGLGLAGLAALALGHRVCFSDYDPAAFEFVHRSARENGFGETSYTTRVLDWRDPPAERYRLVLGADVLYERRLVPLVAGLLAAVLAPDGLALIATPDRPTAGLFPAELAGRGLACRAEPASVREESGLLVRGTVFRVARPGTLIDAPPPGGPAGPPP